MNMKTAVGKPSREAQNGSFRALEKNQPCYHLTFGLLVLRTMDITFLWFVILCYCNFNRLIEGFIY